MFSCVTLVSDPSISALLPMPPLPSVFDWTEVLTNDAKLCWPGPNLWLLCFRESATDTMLVGLLKLKESFSKHYLTPKVSIKTTIKFGFLEIRQQRRSSLPQHRMLLKQNSTNVSIDVDA